MVLTQPPDVLVVIAPVTVRAMDMAVSAAVAVTAPIITGTNADSHIDLGFLKQIFVHLGNRDWLAWDGNGSHGGRSCQKSKASARKGSHH